MRLKRLLLITSMVMSAIILFAGCTGEDVQPVGIYNRTLEAVEAANSFEFVLETEHTFRELSTEEAIEPSNIITTTGSVTLKPLALACEAETLQRIHVDDSGWDVRQSWYIVDDLLYYSQHFMEPDWIVMDSDRLFLHMGRSNTDPMNYFNLLGEEGAAKASLQKEGQHYVIRVDTPYDNLMERIERQLQYIFDISNSSYEISTFEASFWIDHDSYILEKSSFTLEINILDLDGDIIFELKLADEYKNFGTIDKITIPDEVRDNAVDFEDYF